MVDIIPNASHRVALSNPERREASIIYYVNPMSSAIGRPGFVVVTGCGGGAADRMRPSKNCVQHCCSVTVRLGRNRNTTAF